MKYFFEKYPLEFAEMTAIKQIHKTIECAQTKLKEDKHSERYVEYLIKAHQMLECFFTEKGINPNLPR